jgi:hypothetical protein
MPGSVGVRATIFAALFWSIQGASVFDPDGFDFRRLSPRWLAVILFSAIFLAVGALIAVGVERAIDRWPPALPAFGPLVLAVVLFPMAAVGVTSLGLAAAAARWRWLRFAGTVVLVALFLRFTEPTASAVVRILV